MDNVIFEKVKRIVAEKLSVDETTIKADSRFVEDLNADSLDTVEMLMQFEDEFDVEIPDADAEKIVTVANAVEYIEQRKKAA